MRYLPYADGSFEVVIAANVLHLLPEPDKALDEAARVLAPGGLLIVPTFTHAGEGRLARLRLWLMRRAGFPLRWKWSFCSSCADTAGRSCSTMCCRARSR